MGKPKKKAKKLQQREAAMQVAPSISPKVVGAPPGEPDRAVRPTSFMMRTGLYELPKGPGRQERPALNMRPDCIAALMIEPAELDGIQHDSARDWQELRARVRAEIGTPSEGRSCLDISPSGHDGGDGDMALAARWRYIRGSMGPARIAILDRTCIDGAWPKDMDLFRDALDAFAIVAGRA